MYFLYEITVPVISVTCMVAPCKQNPHSHRVATRQSMTLRFAQRYLQRNLRLIGSTTQYESYSIIMLQGRKNNAREVAKTFWTDKRMEKMTNVDDVQKVNGEEMDHDEGCSPMTLSRLPVAIPRANRRTSQAVSIVSQIPESKMPRAQTFRHNPFTRIAYWRRAWGVYVAASCLEKERTFCRCRAASSSVSS